MHELVPVMSSSSLTHTKALLTYLFQAYNHNTKLSSPPQQNASMSKLEQSVRKLALAQARAREYHSDKSDASTTGDEDDEHERKQRRHDGGAGQDELSEDDK